MGCRRKATPDELIRVVRIDEGTVAVGRTLPGRGAWICRGSVRCFDRARANGAFSRAFRAPVSAEALEPLRVELEVASA